MYDHFVGGWFLFTLFFFTSILFLTKVIILITFFGPSHVLQNELKYNEYIKDVYRIKEYIN